MPSGAAKCHMCHRFLLILQVLTCTACVLWPYSSAYAVDTNYRCGTRLIGVSRLGDHQVRNTTCIAPHRPGELLLLLSF